HQINLLEAEKGRIENDITDWENKREIEPGFVESKRQAWEKLSSAGIDYTPFYEAFEFDASIEPDVALCYQNALMESGIMQAVIVKPGDVEKAKQYTTVLEYGTAQVTNLAGILRASKDDDLEKVLLSI